MDKYGITQGGWRKNEITVSFGCGVWRNIMKWWDAFFDNIVFEVGDASRVRFSRQIWCGGMMLKDEFWCCVESLARENHLFINYKTQCDGSFLDMKFRRNF